jgi:hypothetical protein
MIKADSKRTRQAAIGCIAAVVLSATIGSALAEVSLPRQRPGPLALSLIAGSGGTSAEDGEAWRGPIAVIYDSAYCDQNNAQDCALATLTCDDPKGRGLGISVDGLADDQVISWMKDGLTLSLAGIVPERAPSFGEITSNQRNRTWSAVFYAPYSSDPGLRIDGEQLVIKAMPHTISLPLVGETRGKLDRFVELCARK